MLPEVLFAEPSKERAKPEDEGTALMFEKTLAQLTHVHSRQAADDLASELCCHGAAHHRRKLVQVRAAKNANPTTPHVTLRRAVGTCGRAAAAAGASSILRSACGYDECGVPPRGH